MRSIEKLILALEFWNFPRLGLSWDTTQGKGKIRWRAAEPAKAATEPAKSSSEPIPTNAGNTLEERFRLNADGRLLGEIVRKPSGEQVLYFHTDQQGTVEVLSTDAGTSHRREYDVWGAPQFSASEELTRAGYTGHQHDVDLGLIDMRGRIYDPLARRFLTPDPVMQAPFWSQGLNRYSYVFNDPVNRVDPSGFASFNDIMSKAVGTFVALGYGASAVATAGGFFGWSAAGAGGTAAWGGGGIYGTVTDPHFGGAYAGGSGTASLSSSSTTSQALQQRLSEAPDQRTACYPGCEPYSSFPDTPAGREAAKRYVDGSAVWAGSLAAEYVLLKVAGRVAAWWAAGGAVRGGAGVVRVGQAGEAAVRSVTDIGPKVAIDVAGRTRIPDGLTSTVLSEVKNVGSLSYTQQLRDFAAHASANGLRFDLWVRPTTQLSGPLAQEVANGAINLRYIP